MNLADNCGPDFVEDKSNQDLLETDYVKQSTKRVSTAARLYLSATFELEKARADFFAVPTCH